MAGKIGFGTICVSAAIVISLLLYFLMEDVKVDLHRWLLFANIQYTISPVFEHSVSLKWNLIPPTKTRVSEQGDENSAVFNKQHKYIKRIQHKDLNDVTPKTIRAGKKILESSSNDPNSDKLYNNNPASLVFANGENYFLPKDPEDCYNGVDYWRKPKDLNRLETSTRGLILAYSSYGRFGNILAETAVLVHLGICLGRTTIIPREIGEFYNSSRLQSIAPDLPYKVAVSASEVGLTGKSLGNCDGRIQYQRWNDSYTIELLGNTSSPAKARILCVHSNQLFHWKIERDVEASFLEHLYPQNKIERKVTEYISATFGEAPYIAVHLRWLNGLCPKWGGGLLCYPPYELVVNETRKIMGLRSSEKLPSFFIATDNEIPEIVQMYKGKDNVHLFDNCDGSPELCKIIDFEIAARSNLFFGTEVSSFALFIAKLRIVRRLRSTSGPYYPSVLDIDRDLNPANISQIHGLIRLVQMSRKYGELWSSKDVQKAKSVSDNKSIADRIRRRYLENKLAKYKLRP